MLFTPTLWQPADNIYGTSGADLMTPGYGGALHKVGSDDDTVLGLGGNDTIDGGADHDRLDGGAGSDTYLLNSACDAAVDDVGGGTDTAILMVDGLTVGANIESIRPGGPAHVGVGGSTDNHISGAAGADDLEGGGDDFPLGRDGNDQLRAHAGHDALDGGAGDDVYHLSGATVDIQNFLGHKTLYTSDRSGNDPVDRDRLRGGGEGCACDPRWLCLWPLGCAVPARLLRVIQG